jgi:tRNA nucleotidyltransferase (CCA-adding enzyme)
MLRHVGPAFVEDPVRVMRIARFAARFGFAIAPETLTLMRRMVAEGELDYLVPERVWQEIARGLMETRPSRMLVALRECGALARVLPEVDALFGVPQPAQHHPEVDTGAHILLVIDYAATRDYPLVVRFAALTHDLGKGATPPEEWPSHRGHEERGVELVEALCERLRVPTECRDLAVLASRYHLQVHRAEELKAATIVKLLEKIDAFRRPQRFELLLNACECDYRGRAGLEARPYPGAELLQKALAAARSVNAGEIAQQTADPARIGAVVHEARVHAVKHALRG